MLVITGHHVHFATNTIVHTRILGTQNSTAAALWSPPAAGFEGTAIPSQGASMNPRFPCRLTTQPPVATSDNASNMLLSKDFNDDGGSIGASGCPVIISCRDTCTVCGRAQFCWLACDMRFSSTRAECTSYFCNPFCSSSPACGTAQCRHIDCCCTIKVVPFPCTSETGSPESFASNQELLRQVKVSDSYSLLSCSMPRISLPYSPAANHAQSRLRRHTFLLDLEAKLKPGP